MSRGRTYPVDNSGVAFGIEAHEPVALPDWQRRWLMGYVIGAPATEGARERMARAVVASDAVAAPVAVDDLAGLAEREMP